MRTKSSKKSLTDHAAELVEQVGPHVDAARERIVNDYLPAAQTMLAEARETTRDLAQEARDAAQAAAADAERSTRKSRKRAARKARGKAAEWANAAAAVAPAAAAPVAHKVADKVEPKPKRRKRVVLLLAIVGAGVVAFKKLRAGSTSGSTSYAPPPRPRAVPDPRAAPPAPPAQHFEPDPEAPAGDLLTGTGAGTTDQGGAFLDEVAADAGEQPHEVTTPEDPAEVEDVTDAAGARHSRKG